MYSMLSNLEREYLHTFALKKYAGQGAIVDLGCWLGSSTIALQAGSRAPGSTTAVNPCPRVRSIYLGRLDEQCECRPSDTLGWQV
jgi:hypothetical protein